MPEKVLPYSRSLVPQETGWWCGPASVQTALQSRGIVLPESQIANDIEQIENPGRGDDRDGTDYIGIIEMYLARKVPDARYTTVNMPTDPPTQAQKDRLWRDLTRSIDAGWGVIANIVVPGATNPPAGVKGSTPPPYPKWLTTFHYVCLAGYDNSGSRAVWVADSAAFGGITGWWCPFDGPGSICSLIPPKGYCYADVIVPAQTKIEPPKPAPTAPPKPISVDLTAADYLAVTYGDRDAIGVLVRNAKTDTRAARALSRLEQVNPAALQSYLRG